MSDHGGTPHTVDGPMKVDALDGPPDQPGTIHQTHQDARDDPDED